MPTLWTELHHRTQHHKLKVEVLKPNRERSQGTKYKERKLVRNWRFLVEVMVDQHPSHPQGGGESLCGDTAAISHQDHAEGDGAVFISKWKDHRAWVRRIHRRTI